MGRTIGDDGEARPTVDDVLGAKLLRERWDLEAALSDLPGERDRNYRVRWEQGGIQRQAVLKVAAADEPRAALEFQDALLARLEGLDALDVPAVLPTLDGERLVTVAGLDGRAHVARLVTWLEGTPVAALRPRPPALLEDLGGRLGRLDAALAGFQHPGARRAGFEWDLARGLDVVSVSQDQVRDPARRALLEHWRARLDLSLAPQLDALPRAVIHQDANDHNVLAEVDLEGGGRVTGLIDFGDALETVRAAEPAVAAAYAMLGRRAPVAALEQVVRGYWREHPLTDEELASVGELAALRLCVSVALAARNGRLAPDDAYLQVSAGPAWEILERLAATPPALLEAHVRTAAGLEPAPRAARAMAWLRAHPGDVTPVMDGDLTAAPRVDLSIASPLVVGPAGDLDVDGWAPRVEALWREHPDQRAVGYHDEARLVYAGEAFDAPDDERTGELAERRTVHLGVDVFGPAGAEVRAPLPGVVVSVTDNARPLDYGPTLIVRHRAGDHDLDVLYGHLDPEVLERLAPGDAVAPGERIARLGAPEHNGGWTPHLHLQALDPSLAVAGDAPGVAAPAEREAWVALSPDPAPLLGLSGCAALRHDAHRMLEARRARLSDALSLSYRRPLVIVKGRGRHLVDDAGRRYLDGVNNVCHVGHCHPRVVAAAAAQMGVLNTNTRYLHDGILRYSERLLATLPAHLDTLFLVNSGSEANELALRLARAATGGEDVVVQEAGYHGHTRATLEVSHYKFAGRGGFPRPAHVHVAPLPDPDHGLHRGPDSGPAYVHEVEALLERITAEGLLPAAMIAEPLIGCGGQIVPPPGYLAGAFDAVRRTGGVAIADEVQVGLGRVGTHMWAFEADGATPDVVTMGKPLGNGHPLAAVATTRAIAEAFDTGMEYFNTFGGNPVSCAVGLAVLDVLADEGLVASARRVGERFLALARPLAERHPLVAAARGRGLYLGLELAYPAGPDGVRAAAGDVAAYVVERARERGVLLSIDGPRYNVIKIKPPLVFTEADAEHVVELLADVLDETPVERALERGPRT